MKKIFSASMYCLLASFGASMNAFADAPMSWNLARDMLLAKESSPPGFTWAFMQNSSGVNKAENYTPMPDFKADTCNNLPGTCWKDPASEAHVSVQFKPYTYSANGTFTIAAGNVAFHPGKNSQTIIRWTSPVVGEVSILGRVNSIHDSCGDGVAWSLNLGDTVLQSGSLVRGNGAIFSASKVPVTKASAIYLVLDKKANYTCDTSTVDMLITK